MEGWLSLFRYLTDVEARGGGKEVNPGLVGFVARAQLSAFKTPLPDNSKRTRDAMMWDDEEELPPAFLGHQDAIMGIQGELGVRFPTAGYVTLHGGLKNAGEPGRPTQSHTRGEPGGNRGSQVRGSASLGTKP